MRVERLRIGAFGRLHAVDTGDEPLPGLVAVYGPNEAGKTTFFHFLTTLLYGFQPASRDKHPYAPWDGGGAEGEAVLRVATGDAWEVRRRLLSSPAGSLVRGDREEDLKNRSLPCVEHVPRTVFRQVFALTLAELAGLEGESWAAVQDRLLGAMGATDLRPARIVAGELEREAAELWRPNRRGRQRARELKARIQELKQRRVSALEVDRQLRDAAAALRSAKQELLQLRDERAACRTYLERYRTLLPLRAQLRRIEGLEGEAGDVEELNGLPADPRAQLSTFDGRLAELEELLARTAQEEREPRARIEAYGRAEEQLVRRGEVVRSLVARAHALDSERVRQGQLEQEIRDLDRRSETLAAELFRAPLAQSDRDRVRTIGVAELREAVRVHRTARDAWRVADESARNLGSEVGPVPPAWAAGTLLVLALLAVALGIYTRSLLVAALSTPAIAVGIALLFWRTGIRRAHEHLEAARTRTAEAARVQEDARLAAVGPLAGLPLREAIALAPDAEMVGAVERLQELLRDRDDRSDSLAALEGRADDVASSVQGLARELRMELPPDAAASAHLLSAKLRESESRREAAASARRELERVLRSRRRLEEEHERIRSERAALQGRLERLGAGDWVRGLETARARLEALALARHLRDELSRAHADVEEITSRVAEAESAGEEWTVDEDALEKRKAREEELTDRIESLARRTEALAHDVERLRGAETADSVEGEILIVEEELAEVRRERDRRWLLARVVREAERRFREEHQPDIVREAGRHLETITGGRYRRILVGDGEEGSFLLHGPGYPAPVRVGHPISTGTREQLYLALRLAIVDHLDRGGERLPLFMDEAFVNWDPERLGRGLDVLRSVAESRQVFLFTCHLEVVERLHAHGARVLRLDRAS
jgi:uncharacterized protein YhaN